MPNYNTQLQSNNADLQALLDTINELPNAGGGEPVLQDKIVTPSTASQTIMADSGYDGLDTVTVNAMPTATQATPSITINASGLITATATQTSGYVTAGTKSATKQLAFQAAKTITPTTASQIAVSSGYYTGGNITVAGDSNLVPSNIVSGKSIFGVVGTATAGDDPFAASSPFTYTINAISGAQYGFTKNSNGYYESQNKGQNNSYAICRVNLTVTSTCDIVFDVINYAEGNYDYAVFGNLDSALALSNTADSSAKKNFKGQQSASVVNVTYSGVTVGNHYIDIKFIKDTSQHNNNDSVQFKLQEQKGDLSQETINKILAADTDLVADNIKSGVDIFGVVGTYAGDGGGSSGDTNIEDSFITRTTLTSCTNSRVKTIGSYAFYQFSRLTSVSFPVCTSISGYAFYGCGLTTASFPEATSIHQHAFDLCGSLTTINFPKITNIVNNVFANCYKLTQANFPMVTDISSYAFHYCSSLATVSLPKAVDIGSSAFKYCFNLKSLYLTGSSICALRNKDAFSSTPIGGYSASAGAYGSIYVPASLLASYRNATNWAYFSSRFVGIDGDSGDVGEM